MTSFLKMHGLGNDFVVFDGRIFPPALDTGRIQALSDRKRGIGCDQLIVIEAARKNGAHAFMRIYNADGGEVKSCGNAARCVAFLLMAEMETRAVKLATKGGPLFCTLPEHERVPGTGPGAGIVTVDMGEPNFDWREIPMAQAVETTSFALKVDGFHDSALENVASVSMGNPHCVVFVKDAERAPATSLGPAIEHHPWFPARTNVEFVERRDAQTLRMRVWERGVGVTLACGTGACAAAVTANLRGLTGRKVKVGLDGGALDIEWRESDDHVLMTGPARISYEGEVDINALSGAA